MKGPCLVGIIYDRLICYQGFKEMSDFLLWREPKSQVTGLFDFFSLVKQRPISPMNYPIPRIVPRIKKKKKTNQLLLNWLGAMLADRCVSVVQCPRQLSIYPSLHTMNIHRPKAMTITDGRVNTSDRSRKLHCRSRQYVPIEEDLEMKAITNADM